MERTKIHDELFGAEQMCERARRCIFEDEKLLGQIYASLKTINNCMKNQNYGQAKEELDKLVFKISTEIEVEPWLV